MAGAAISLLYLDKLKFAIVPTERLPHGGFKEIADDLSGSSARGC